VSSQPTRDPAERGSAGPLRGTPYRLALCGHKAAEVAGVCMLLMVQGHLAAITGAHVLIAGKTGALAIVPALLVTFTRWVGYLANRWTSSAFIGLCGFAADAIIHGSHYPGAYTEAILTGIGTTIASVLVSYTPLGKRIEHLAEPLIHRRPATESA